MNWGRYRFKLYLNARHKIKLNNIDSGIHPHTWEIILYLKKCREDFVQFSEVEYVIKDFLSSYEGKCLNEAYPFDSIMPTQENIGEVFATELIQRLAKNGWELESLEISENPARTYIVDKSAIARLSRLSTDLVYGKVAVAYIGKDMTVASKKSDIETDKALSCGMVEADNVEIDRAASCMRNNSGGVAGEGAAGDDVAGDDVAGDDVGAEVILPVNKEKSNSVLYEGSISSGEDIKDDNEQPAMLAVETPIPKRNRKKKQTNKIGFWIVALAVLFAAGAALFFWLTRNGAHYPWGSDSWYHLFKGHMLYSSAQEGNFFPLYSDIWYNGIQPLRYWAPLPHYVLALFEFLTGGNIGLSYNLFLVFVYIVGGIGWILWGVKLGRHRTSLILAVIWTLLPDNLRVMFSEGNISRVMVTAIFPYLLFVVYMYFTDASANYSIENGATISEFNANSKEQQRYRVIYLCWIAVLMVLITFSHAMISAMVAVTVTLFSVIYGIGERKVACSIHIVAATAFGIAVAGIWLVPALTGGLLSMDGDAVKELAQGLTYPMLDTLDPTRRLSDPNVFYFGTSIFLAAIFGLVFGEKQSRAAFAVTLIIFAGTTKALLPLILKLPLSQAFWMMRFTPLAMGTFFAGLFFWRKLNKKILVMILVLVIVDSSVSFVKLAHNSDMPAKAVDMLNVAAELTDNRIALIDHSTMGSFPSFYLSYNESGKISRQVFGSGWQGASTAQNIMLLNTTTENGWYHYLFDRSLEYGADVVVITGEMVDSDSGIRLSQAARIAGYDLAYEDKSNAMIFKYPVEGSFGTVVRYKAIGIGRYASNLSLVFPQLETGASNFIDDYTLKELSEYKTVYLSGFSFKSKDAAERLILQLSEAGTRVVVDLINAEAELLSSRAGFLGVVAETSQFEGKLPDIETPAGTIGFTSFIPEIYQQWRSIHLQNLDTVQVSTYYDDQQLDIVGTKHNDNIVFVGMNLPYYAMLTGDQSAIGILEDVLSLKAGDLPDRRAVKLEISTKANVVELKAEEPGVITGVAALDTFEALKGEYSVTHDIVRMHDKELILNTKYPETGKGLAVSILGVASLVTLILRLSKKKGGDTIA